MAWEITPEELLVRYDDGERNFAGIKLIYSYGAPTHYSGIDLKGIVLRDINLRGAYFEQISMVGIDLTGADLGGVFMHCCNVSNAIIRNANLCAANLGGSSFIGSDLRGSLLDYMDASVASFRQAKMSGRAFEQAILAQTDFQGTDITNRRICSRWNLIWNTTMPDGSVIEGPQWGNGHDAK